MAEVATLARHLLMAEVLQICESIHKKVEEQKLMVYQRGDIHTVVAVPPEPVPPTDSETYVVTMQSDGQVVAHPEAGQSLAVITREDGTAKSLALLAGATVDGQTMTVVTHSGQAGSAESLAMVAHSGESVEGETMTLVTHSGQAGSGESLAVVQACWSVEEPQVGDTPVAESVQPGAFLITVDPGKADATEVVHLAAAAPPAVQAGPTQQPEPAAPLPQQAPAPVKRRPGRPPKVKQPEPPPPPVEEPAEMEGIEDAAAADEEKREMESIDPNKRYLRKRSMKEGSYVRLHMGLENEEEENSSSPPMKVCRTNNLNDHKYSICYILMSSISININATQSHFVRLSYWNITVPRHLKNWPREFVWFRRKERFLVSRHVTILFFIF